MSEEKLDSKDIQALNSEMQSRGEVLDKLSEAGKKAGAAIRQVAEKYIGKEMMDKIAGKDDEDKDKEKKEDDEEKKKKKGGSCGAGANQSESSSDSPPGKSDGTSPSELGDVGLEDVDDSINKMCKKIYTIYRPIPLEMSCPQSQRDNVSDQTTPQDDLLTMERTVRNFLNLEGKIYDPESTNPRFFASESWVQKFEKDKNVVMALYDQFKANIVRMEHIQNVVDNQSAQKMCSIPNENAKSTFQTNIQWSARALKDWIENWFIEKCCAIPTILHCKDYWLPDLAGQMCEWMKLGTYCEFNMRPVGIEQMIKKVDALEGVIDRMVSSETVQNTISKFMNLKERLEQKADQKKDTVFTSTIIDATMGEKLGVTNTGTTNDKVEGTVTIAPKPDDVEKINLVCKLSCVKKLFKELRQKSLETLKSCRCVSSAGPGPYPDIWTQIDVLASPLYADLEKMNNLILDLRGDKENPGGHCDVCHAKLCGKELKKRITTFKCVIQQGVIDVMVNQACLPKKGLNVLDSMFNQLWEYGEKGPTLEMPSWCQEAIVSINDFEKSFGDAWSEIYDCWEREFITRVWRIVLEHHGDGDIYTQNWVRQQLESVETSHDHTHNISVGTLVTSATPAKGAPLFTTQIITTTPPINDMNNFDITAMKGQLVCPGHLDLLLKPICMCYRKQDINPLSRTFRPNLKALCRWMTAAIQAIGIKQAAISAVMSDPTLNGNCCNKKWLQKINCLKEKNNKILEKVEHAYGIYSDVDNMKNKKEYDEQIALHELQPNKYSNEDQLNMTSSVQFESNEEDLSAELCQGGIEIPELKPWNHMELSENKIEPKPIPSTCACNKFDKLIQTISGLENGFKDEGSESSSQQQNNAPSQTKQNAVKSVWNWFAGKK